MPLKIVNVYLKKMKVYHPPEKGSLKRSVWELRPQNFWSTPLLSVHFNVCGQTCTFCEIFICFDFDLREGHMLRFSYDFRTCKYRVYTLKLSDETSYFWGLCSIEQRNKELDPCFWSIIPTREVPEVLI